MDDIQDNPAFREYAEKQPLFRVFEYEGKYVGVTGPALSSVARNSP
ncbi:hypothetical protein ACQP25_13185 [Microtetraspora malaysiensis]